MFSKKVKPWYIWFLGALFYAYENFMQVSQGVMSGELMRHFNITALQLSSMSSLYFLSYSIAQIPIGLALDKFGAKKPLMIAILLCSTGAIIFAYADYLLQAEIARMLIGLGSSFAALSCMYIAAIWFPINKFTTLTGMLLAIGMSGQVLAEKPLAIWLSHTHWQSIMLTLSTFGVCLFLTIALLMPNKKKQNINPLNKNSEKILNKCKFIFTHKDSWLIAGYAMLMFTPFLLLASLWGVPFVTSFTGQPPIYTAEIVSYLPIGFAIGAPILGYLADQKNHKIKIMFIATLASLTFISLIIYMPQKNYTYTSALFFLFGFFSSGFLAAFSMIKDLHKERMKATALGFANSLNMIATWIALPVIGLILDYNWQGGLYKGARIYTTSSYKLALSICPILIFIALILITKISKLRSTKNA